MSTTLDRPPIAQPRTQTAQYATQEPKAWMGMAIAAHMFERRVAPINPRPIAVPVHRHPAGRSPRPTWPAFRPAARPKHARYLSFADRDHLIRYIRARAEISS